MNLNKLFLTKNECYIAGEKITPKGIMVHSTGADNPNLKRYLPDDGKIGENQAGNHWNTLRPGGRKVCVHAFIGKLADGSIATYQTLPWNHRAWHGGGSSNNTHIGFEICEDGLTDRTYFNAVYKEAVELCAYLCKEYGLTEKNIICHSEGYKKGIASNHSDVMHWFPKHGKSMDTFRADVKALLSPKRKDLTTVNDIVWELHHRGIITNKPLWLDKCDIEKESYDLAFAMANKTVNTTRPNKLESENDIVWELHHRKLIADKASWLQLIAADKDLYWLAYKAVNMTKNVG